MTKDYEYTGEEPLNREPKITDLLSNFLSTKDPYDRNHGPIPEIDSSKHIVHIDGLVDRPLELSFDQLRNDFPQHEVLCALQCAGNRRHTMRTKIKEVQGIDWFDGAVMNCLWKGPLLADVLSAAGISDELRSKSSTEDDDKLRGHAAFACHAQPVQDDSWYGGAISLARALDPAFEVILALEMNGEPLTPEHGAPVRVIVPGVAGARSVKWLDRVTIQLEDSPNFYQQHDYKILPPQAVDKESAEEYWGKIEPMMDMPVNSIIGVPENGTTINLSENGTIEVKGYAVPHGEDGPIRKVEISADGGNTWTEAELNYGGYGNLNTEEGRSKIKWAWCLWRAEIEMTKGPGQRIVSRATDFAGHSQDEESRWNLRGVGYNGYGEAANLTIE